MWVVISSLRLAAMRWMLWRGGAKPQRETVFFLFSKSTTNHTPRQAASTVASRGRGLAFDAFASSLVHCDSMTRCAETARWNGRSPGGRPHTCRHCKQLVLPRLTTSWKKDPASQTDEQRSLRAELLTYLRDAPMPSGPTSFIDSLEAQLQKSIKLVKISAADWQDALQCGCPLVSSFERVFTSPESDGSIFRGNSASSHTVRRQTMAATSAGAEDCQLKKPVTS